MQSLHIELEEIQNLEIEWSNSLVWRQALFKRPSIMSTTIIEIDRELAREITNLINND